MSRGPGIDFERQVIESLPRGVWHHKIATPPPPVPGGRIAAYITGLLENLKRLRALYREASAATGRFAAEEGDPVSTDLPDWIKAGLFSRFTASPGFDLLVIGPAPIDRRDSLRPLLERCENLAEGIRFNHPDEWERDGLAPLLAEIRREMGQPTAGMIFDAIGKDLGIRPVALVGVAMELKSTDKGNLPFDLVNREQEKGLSDAAAGGLIAGVLIEWRGCAPASRCCFVPIARWLEIRLIATRKSLPIAEAFAQGIEVEPDEHRGRTKQYWRLDDFLSRCGILLPEREPKAKPAAPKRAPAETLPLFR